MKRVSLLIFVALALSAGSLYAKDNMAQKSALKTLYDQIKLDEKGLKYDVFEKGVIGFNKIGDKRKNILTLIDFSKPSTEPRLFVIDLQREELLFSTYVSHGKGSGGLFATNFSNVEGSHKSSLGFYVTEQTYFGRNGYSLRLNGLEEGINDKAKSRAIVVHGAKYSNPETIKNGGRLGRSLGCPAVPISVSKKLIDTIKDGTVLYIHAEDEKYIKESKF